MHKIISVACATFAIAAACAPAAQAADVNVDGAVVSGISLTVNTPSVMTLFPGQTNTSVGNVVVTSTAPSWTLSISDSATAGYPSGHTAGRMVKLDGTGTCGLLGSFVTPIDQLASPLGWSATAVGGSSGTLSAGNQTIKTGTLVETVPVTYSQVVGAAEDLATGDCYRAVVTYTVS